MKAYIVQQGDHLAALADRMGFDADEVWNHEQNSEIHERRDDPQQLAAGDILYVPEPVRGGQLLSPQTTNRYQVTVASMPVSVTLRTATEMLANAECEIFGMGEPLSACSDGDGVLTFEAPTTAREIRIRVVDHDFALALRIGHLDPISEESGVRQRLENLGFMLPLSEMRHADPQSVLHAAEYRRERISGALRAFQASRDIDPSGVADDVTRDALREAHGS